ncbi:MAG: helicase-associated domain-containing protein [Spirochaetaceae bacterium]|jgi:hypothetical protein|nr:helicase-associated domain-containing protein [Spirochaetaceae bacterium]
MPEQILKWREALTKLSDHHFFELMRMYLGEIKTPFNKQKLIEELGAFLRKQENRKALIGLLDEMDLLVLSAVQALSLPTQEKLVKLFSGTFPFAVLYERLLNMEERLILFRIREETLHTGEHVFRINPYILDDIAPYIGTSLLLPVTAREDSAFVPVPQPFPDDLTLGSLLPFFTHTKDAVKNDGELKKRADTLFRELFPLEGREISQDVSLKAPRDSSGENAHDISRLIASLKNLSLLRQQQFSLVPDIGRWYSFAELTQRDRYLYLAAAASGHVTREVLIQNARLVLDIVLSLPPAGGFTEAALYRSAFIQRERSCSGRGRSHGTPLSRQEAGGSNQRQGRFAALLEQEARREKEDPSAEQAIIPSSADSLIESAIAFGLIVKQGELYYRNPFFAADAGSVPEERLPPTLHVDGGFSVTIFPGLSLKALLDLLVFLEIVSVDTAGRFELSKRSCLAGFDSGLSPSDIIARLEQRSGHPLPQNILFSINEWYTGYTAVSLYHGYVVQAEESRRVLIENSQLITPRIRKILAPGIYLLDFDSPEEAAAAFKAAGIDSLGAVNSAVSKPSPAGKQSVPVRGSILPPLPVRSTAAGAPAGTASGSASGSASLLNRSDNSPSREDILSSLYGAVDAMELPGDQAEALRSRISRRVVLNPTQLRPESVRFERIEAGGMDFLGKVHVVEHAIASASLVELVYDDTVLLGSPIKIEKREGDAFLKIMTEPEGLTESVSIGKAAAVKRIRGSVFKERS